MKYLILGAGPAGLTLANRLKQSGETSFLVLEKENEAGGLCRSVDVDGSPFDIGGGHFLDVRRTNVNDFLFQFMPEDEWDKYDRDSRIEVNGNVVSHPIEANIWQMKLDDQVEYLKSIAVAGCNLGSEMPKDFVDWIYWKLGSKVAEDYMIPYNQKMFSKELDQLGTYWLEKLPNVSFEETLLSCLTKKAYGEQPGHAQFYYPKKYGYGELWLRMAEAIKENIEYNKSIQSIDFSNKIVMTSDGTQYQADIIITTIPWMGFKEIIGMPEDIKESIQQLKFSSIQTGYVAEKLDTDAQWIYCPDPKLPYHRILVRHNFCPNSKGYWTETNGERIEMEEPSNNFKYMNQHAYPLNTISKPEIMEKLLNWSAGQSVYGLGRWGEHQHYNSDVTVDLAMQLADKFINSISDTGNCND
ncbi:UDP-galactopyranose mutase [Trichococcus patagoniensis]|uniref:UDP-galactopyranose mutase n=1 Tax=Trichococcus patagoniensis TaxID=382641 RepID=A0A2T5IQ39_9LACT|nr:FAD-dependent oxidoreductase [Trichococcus patagoniensis]PTQ85941.1 UDP-galactopyranose mutase [Trichococcus patagoniensis]